MSKDMDAYPGMQSTRRMAESDDEADPSISLVSLADKKAAKKAANKAKRSDGAVTKPRATRPSQGASPASPAQGRQAAARRSRAKPLGSPAKAASSRDGRLSSSKKVQAEEHDAILAEKKRARLAGAVPAAKRRLQGVCEDEEEEEEEEEEAAAAAEEEEAAGAHAADEVLRESYKYDEISGCRVGAGAAAALPSVMQSHRFKYCEYRVQ